jgi:hypothetical protein
MIRDGRLGAGANSSSGNPARPGTECTRGSHRFEKPALFLGREYRIYSPVRRSARKLTGNVGLRPAPVAAICATATGGRHRRKPREAASQADDAGDDLYYRTVFTRLLEPVESSHCRIESGRLAEVHAWRRAGCPTPARAMRRLVRARQADSLALPLPRNKLDPGPFERGLHGLDGADAWICRTLFQPGKSAPGHSRLLAELFPRPAQERARRADLPAADHAPGAHRYDSLIPFEK